MAGYFIGLWLGIGLIVLGIEFYYFIVAKYLEKDLTLFESLVFIGCLILSIWIFIKSFSSSDMFLLGLVSFLPLPVSAVIINKIVSSKEKIEQKIEEDNALKNWLYTIEKQPENVNAYVSAGDIYFNRKNYEKALDLYQKALQIMEMPYILQRIRTTEKEIKIMKGIIWVCPECSFDNPGEMNKCRVCGYSKIDRDLIRDARQHKKEMIKATALIVFGPIAVLVFVALYIIMPPYIALFLTLLVIYLTIRYFTTY